MSTNASQQGFGVDLNDLNQQFQNLISSIDLMDENVSAAAQDVVLESGEIIAAEQRRLISRVSSKLPGYIQSGRIEVTKKGQVQVRVGYDSEAIKAVPHSVVLEFGKPGKRSKTGRDTLGRRIGKQDAVPHIRQGADNKLEQAYEHATEKLLEAVEW